MWKPVNFTLLPPRAKPERIAGMSQNLTKLFNGRGVFDDFTVYGFLYHFDGEVRQGWNITAHRGGGQVKHYWVEGGEFHAVGTHLMMPPTGGNFIEIGGVIEVAEGERKAILSAIEEWMQAYQSSAT